MSFALIVARCTWPRMSLRILPSALLLVLAVTQADAVVDWGATAELAAALSPGWKAVVIAALLASWVPPLVPAVRAAWRPLGWVARQPVGPTRLGGALLPGLVACASPVFVGALLLGSLPAAVVALAGAVWAAQAVAGRRWGVAITVSAAGAGLGALATLPLGWLVLPVVAVVPTAVGWHWAVDRRAVSRGPRPSRWRARGPLSALVLRDLRALRRTRPAVMLGALLVAAPATAAQGAVVANNPGLDGGTARMAAVLALVVVSPAAMAGLVQVAVALGDAFDRARDPVSARARAGTLTAVYALLVAPTVAGLLAVGTGDGLFGAVQVVTVAGALAGGGAWAVSAPGTAAARGHAGGTWLWWALLVALVGTRTWGTVGCGLLGLGAWLLASRALAHHREHPC